MLCLLAGLSKYYVFDLPDNKQSDPYIPLNFESDLDNCPDTKYLDFSIHLLLRAFWQMHGLSECSC